MYKDITGQKFGLLTVLNISAVKTKFGAYQWDCKCECGTVKTISGLPLRGGKIRSCGCFHKATVSTHGATNTPEFRVWTNLKDRCLNPNSRPFKYYGARGIGLDERWLKFENFLEDLGQRPSAKHSIDRINNNGNYEPGNCRWATSKKQQNNRSNTVMLEADGVRMPITEACRLFGIKNRCSIYPSKERSLQECFNAYVLKRGLRPNYILFKEMGS